MKLHEFITENMERILQEWESFAREVWPSESPITTDLRDHAKEMLNSIVSNMQTVQTEKERHEKSLGKGVSSTSSDQIDSSSKRHSEDRLDCGFDLRTLVAEYRALRASVLHMWSETPSEDSATQLKEMTRFNECVDQLLAESVLSYTETVDQSRELFLGILAHDLRTPLCTVTTAGGLLEEKAELSDPTRRLASLVVSSARTMKNMVNDLLDFTGNRLGLKMNIERQSMNIAQLGNEVIEEMRAEHPSRAFQFETRGNGVGEWDPLRIRQIMTNLLVNAVKHGNSGTPIRMFIKEDGNGVVLGVGNQGQPIPASARTMIFNPLRRPSADGSPQSSGKLGLGLYIAREVASAHGGEIEVKSDERETVFAVKLPRNEVICS